jgi:DNA-binding transcriptional regulator PaaX
LQVKEIQAEVKKELKKLGFGQLKDGLDEYFNETKRFVDARRYRGLIKEEVL